MRPNLTVVTLGVADLRRSHDFYVRRLGWPTESKLEDGVLFLRLHGIVLALWSRELLAKDIGVADGGGSFGGTTLAHNAQDRAEVDKAMAEAKAAGARILKPAQETFWGGYSGYWADPDGHVWEVAWNPHWRLRDDGTVA
ncbi:MAG: VOC family protein [Thermoplasmatota archaeon]